DLRLGGAALPPVLCLIALQSEGLVLRKLAPTQPVLVNGHSITTTSLSDGDRVTLGAVDLTVHIDSPFTIHQPPTGTAPGTRDSAKALDERQRQLEEQARELETDRIIWYHRRQEIEQECKQQSEAAETVGKEVRERERALSARARDLEQQHAALEEEKQQLAQQHADLETRQAALRTQEVELERSGQAVAVQRAQQDDRYRQRRDRLAGLQEAVQRAARKVQEDKRALDAQSQEVAALEQQFAARRTEMECQAAAVEQERRELTQQSAAFDAREQEQEQTLAARLV